MAAVVVALDASADPSAGFALGAVLAVEAAGFAIDDGFAVEAAGLGDAAAAPVVAAGCGGAAGWAGLGAVGLTGLFLFR